MIVSPSIIKGNQRNIGTLQTAQIKQTLSFLLRADSIQSLDAASVRLSLA
jgi:hypothetical protein